MERKLKGFFSKTKQMYLFYGFSGLSFIAIAVCIIVDLALNKGITWSLIPVSACLFADLLLYVLLDSKHNKGFIPLIIISIGTFCLLSVIQVTNYYIMGFGSMWLFHYGLPILLLWLSILWIPMLSRKFFKLNIWYCISLFLLLSIIGNYITNVITSNYSWKDVFNMRNFLNNGLVIIIIIIIFTIIGIVRKQKQ